MSDEVRYSGLRGGKSILTYLGFINSIQTGKRAIIFGPDYVVMSKKEYERICGVLGRGEGGEREDE